MKPWAYHFGEGQVDEQALWISGFPSVLLLRRNENKPSLREYSRLLFARKGIPIWTHTPVGLKTWAVKTRKQWSFLITHLWSQQQFPSNEDSSVLARNPLGFYLLGWEVGVPAQVFLECLGLGAFSHRFTVAAWFLGPLWVHVGVWVLCFNCKGFSRHICPTSSGCSVPAIQKTVIKTTE